MCLSLCWPEETIYIFRAEDEIPNELFGQVREYDEVSFSVLTFYFLITFTTADIPDRIFNELNSVSAALSIEILTGIR